MRRTHHWPRGLVRAETLIPWMILGWLGLGVAAPSSAGVAPTEPPAAAPPASFTADLTYEETDELLDQVQVGVKLQRPAFKKEPRLPRQKVFRGSLLWGPRPDQAMAFLWGKTSGQLYLDLNRNRDLTDDPAGIFTSDSKGHYQIFTNVHLVLRTAAGDRPARLLLQLINYRAGEVIAQAALCSYWQGRVSLHGKEWQFGLMASVLEDNASASPEEVLLRPWAERQRPVNSIYSTPDVFNYTRNIFFGDHAYELDCRYDPGGASPKYRVTFKEQAPRLGELKITGTDLHRLILAAMPELTVVLDQPAGTVKLPVGSYSLAQVWLRKGETEGASLGVGKLTVNEQRPASLLAGGPLTNSIQVGSEGYNLLLNYALLGAGGRGYKMPGRDGKHWPEFAVFQGTNRLAAGKFQPG